MALQRGVYPTGLRDPFADEATQPFWDAALEGRLVGSRCTTCGTIILPPQPRCFSCQGTEFAWVDLPGTGTIYSFTVVRHPLDPALAEVVPYVSAVIELDGTQGPGARLSVNVIDCDPEQVDVGDPVEVVFDKVSDTLAVPRCRPRP
ncbi:MAG TPA: Zn-ribbon domain-containing OB-fold protein [Acidimicrobiales bacterium]|nr:Zn-ribbon domain-containing OB-fold protein [Acidimicrobiales bacterium]